MDPYINDKGEYDVDLIYCCINPKGIAAFEEPAVRVGNLRDLTGVGPLCPLLYEMDRQKELENG